MARLVVPRAPEVANEVGLDLTDAQFLSVEEYLLDHGYVASADIGLVWSTFTLTPAGLRWLEANLPEPSPTNRMQELTEGPDEEGAFESALRAELEKERRRMEGFERSLGEEPPGALETAAEGRGSEETRPGGVEAQEPAEARSWWRRMFGE